MGNHRIADRSRVGLLVLISILCGLIWHSSLRAQTCGDVNNSSAIDLLDMVYIIQYTSFASPAPSPRWTADTDSIEGITFNDAMYIASNVFVGAPAPTCTPRSDTAFPVSDDTLSIQNLVVPAGDSTITAEIHLRVTEGAQGLQIPVIFGSPGSPVFIDSMWTVANVDVDMLYEYSDDGRAVLSFFSLGSPFPADSNISLASIAFAINPADSAQEIFVQAYSWPDTNTLVLSRFGPFTALEGVVPTTVGFVTEPDLDGDGIENYMDNCPFQSNAGQEEDDDDHWGNACDNCPSLDNYEQGDNDRDGVGNRCDEDFRLCGDANLSREEEITTADRNTVAGWLYEGNPIPLEAEDLGDVDGFAGLTNNDLVRYYEVLSFGTMAFDCAMQPSVFPVRADSLNVYGGRIDAGDTQARIDIWFAPEEIVAGFCFPFNYTCSNCTPQLDSIVSYWHDGNAFDYELIDLGLARGMIASTISWYGQADTGMQQVASLYFTFPSAPVADTIQVTPDTYEPSHELVVSYYGDGPYLPTLQYYPELSGPGCCQGVTGNVDDDPDGIVDLGDLLTLANNIFLGGNPLACVAAGNTDGDPLCILDLGDVLWLANAVFLGGPPNADCMLECEE